MQQHTFQFAGQDDVPLKLPKVEYDLPQPAGNFCGLVLMGEAPGAEEVRLGRPFVGRSGQLLDKMLDKAGIERKKCLVANVFRYQPPGNKVDHFFTSRRNAAKEGIEIAEHLGAFGSACCRGEYAGEIEHLRRTLARIKPKAIMALGRTPMWALTGENGLLTRVGQTLKGRLLADVPVIPTYHPSFILRGNWKLQDDWLGHFLAGKKLIS